MDLEKVEGLVRILENSSLNTMSIKDGDFKIVMSKLDHPLWFPKGEQLLLPMNPVLLKSRMLWKRRQRYTLPVLSWEPFIRIRTGYSCLRYGGRHGQSGGYGLYSGSYENDE